MMGLSLRIGYRIMFVILAGIRISLTCELDTMTSKGSPCKNNLTSEQNINKTAPPFPSNVVPFPEDSSLDLYSDAYIQNNSTNMFHSAGQIESTMLNMGKSIIRKTRANSRLRRNAPMSDRQARDLIQYVAIYLQHHKFYEFDQRYESRNHYLVQTGRMRKPTKGAFVKSFSKPPLRTLNRELKEKCEKGFYECLKYIAHFTVHSHIHKFMVLDIMMKLTTKVQAGVRFLRRAYANDKFNYQPFANHLQLFQFRATAIYYMCWFTMQKIRVLDRFPDRCNYWWIGDYRTTNTEDFQCALYSFCPDVCCGNVPHAIYFLRSADKCQFARENPCFGVADGTCEIPFDQNKDFNALVNNKMNTSCQCNKHRAGYKWSSELSKCIGPEQEGGNKKGQNHISKSRGQNHGAKSYNRFYTTPSPSKKKSKSRKFNNMFKSKKSKKSKKPSSKSERPSKENDSADENEENDEDEEEEGEEEEDDEEEKKKSKKKKGNGTEEAENEAMPAGQNQRNMYMFVGGAGLLVVILLVMACSGGGNKPPPPPPPPPVHPAQMRRPMDDYSDY